MTRSKMEMIKMSQNDNSVEIPENVELPDSKGSEVPDVEAIQ